MNDDDNGNDIQDEDERESQQNSHFVPYLYSMHLRIAALANIRWWAGAT